jgi:hypothetical protein
MDDQRSTTEVIHSLGYDCKRSHESLLAAIDRKQATPNADTHADYEFHARQLVRAFFAYFEAVTFSVKAWSANHCLDHNIQITPQERYFAVDTEYELNDRGEVVEAVAKISLSRNIRYALALNRRANRVTGPFDPNVPWWSHLRKAIRLRDRLTHPKMPGDLDVSGEDLIDVMKAREGFEAELLSHGQSRTAA